MRNLEDREREREGERERENLVFVCVPVREEGGVASKWLFKQAFAAKL
jgi:hypothetical protein